MKKPLCHFIDQRGFFLPHVLFIISLTLLIVSANIKIYSNEVYMMNQLTEQIKIETLMQMGYARYKEDLENGEDMANVMWYTFPSGKVKVTYVSREENKVFVRYQIITEKQTSFLINGYINVEYEQINNETPISV